MNRQSLLPLLLLTSGCASGPMTADELADRQYDREVARIEAAEAFARKMAACEQQGGAVVVHRRFSRRMPISPAEVSLATCVPMRAGYVF